MSTGPNDIESQQTEVPEVDYATEAQAVPESTGPSEAQLLAQLMSDPDIQAVLAARNAGQQVQIVAGDGKQDPTLPAEEDYSELEEFGPDIKKLVGLIDKKIGSRLDPVAQKVGLLETLAAGLQRREVTDQIAVVAKKHPDFEKYRKKMAEMSRQEGMSGLGVEELLYIAKSRAGELSLSEPSTHSERPTPTPRRPGVGATKDDKKQMSGRKQFQVTLADALDNLDIAPR